MEDPLDLGLVELHSALMDNLQNSEQDELPPSLRSQIDAFGWLTQELIVNCPDETKELTPLLVACTRGKRETVRALLQWQADVTMHVCTMTIRSDTPYRVEIIQQLLAHATPAIIQRVFWLSCQYNEVTMAKACLGQGACLDSNLKFHDDLKGTPAIWRGIGSPVPVLYAASEGYIRLLRMLEKHGADMEISDDEDIGPLTLAAFGRHVRVVEHLTSSKDTTISAADRANAYEVLGAAHVVAGDVAAGKTAWKKAISILERDGSHKSRHVAARMQSLNTMLGFRTAAELDEMRAKEFRIQALIIFERHLFGTRLFIKALLAAPYTIDVAIETLSIILRNDDFTVENLRQIKEHLDTLGFFKAPEMNKIMLCLEWCIAAVGHLRKLEQIFPVSQEDLFRFQALVEFICQILLCLEVYDDIQREHTHLQHLLRRIVGVCHPMAHACSLLHHLLRVRLQQRTINENNIFTLLIRAGADMVVFDANQNSLLHEVAIACDNDLPMPKELIQSLINAEIPLDAVNDKGVSAEDSICRFLDSTSSFNLSANDN